MDTFADRLRFARQHRKLSQGALARASGLSQGAISSYETGHRKSAKEIFKLAHILKVSPTWLSLGSGPMEAPPDSTGMAGSTKKLHDVDFTDFPGGWPFKELHEADYWALTEKQRRLIDHVAATMAKSMHAD